MTLIVSNKYWRVSIMKCVTTNLLRIMYYEVPIHVYDLCFKKLNENKRKFGLIIKLHSHTCVS